MSTPFVAKARSVAVCAPVPDGDILALFRLQRGRRPTPYARFAMAGEAALPLKELCALLGGAAARRESSSPVEPIEISKVRVLLRL